MAADITTVLADYKEQLETTITTYANEGNPVPNAILERLSWVEEALNLRGELDENGNSSTNFARVLSAIDYTETITYIDADNPADRRINTIVRNSNSLGLSYTDTYSYNGSTGDYYLIGVVRT